LKRKKSMAGNMFHFMKATPGSCTGYEYGAKGLQELLKFCFKINKFNLTIAVIVQCKWTNPELILAQRSPKIMQKPLTARNYLFDSKESRAHVYVQLLEIAQENIFAGA
jgi:hypothetical protein